MVLQAEKHLLSKSFMLQILANLIAGLIVVAIAYLILTQERKGQ